MLITITIETRKPYDPQAIAPTLVEAIATELGITFGLGDSPRDNLKVLAVADGEIVAQSTFDNLTDWVESCD